MTGARWIDFSYRIEFFYSRKPNPWPGMALRSNGRPAGRSLLCSVARFVIHSSFIACRTSLIPKP